MNTYVHTQNKHKHAHVYTDACLHTNKAHRNILVFLSVSTGCWNYCAWQCQVKN